MVYRPPSQRTNHRPSKGAVVFCCMLALIVTFIAFVVYASRQPEGVSINIPISKPVDDKPDLSGLESENDLRMEDGRAVTYAGGNFYRANANAYPTTYAKGQLTGAEGTKPQAVKLSFYKEVLLASGAQKPILDDTIRFVADAECAPSASATIASDKMYAYVVQYAIKTPEGARSAQCLKL